MATQSSILAWRTPWTEEPGRLQSIGSQRVGHDWKTFTFTFTSFCGKMKLSCYSPADTIQGSLPSPINRNSRTHTHAPERKKERNWLETRQEIQTRLSGVPATAEDSENQQQVPLLTEEGVSLWNVFIWDEGRGVSRAQEEGWLKWFAQPSGVAECREHTRYQHPACAPGSSKVAV